MIRKLPCGAIGLANLSILILGAMLMPSEHARAQEPNRDPYFTPTGAKSTSYMPRVIIGNILEDRAGNIWFATFGGPIRYDGENFTNFSEEVGLANTRVFSLLEDRTGALWFGSITGGALQLDLKGYEGDQVVPYVVRFDFEEDGSLRHRVWSVEGTEHTLMLDVHQGKESRK